MAGPVFRERVTGVSIVQEKGSTHIYRGRPWDYGPTMHDRQVEAVTFVLELIRPGLFDLIEFDIRLDWDYPDIDFCLQAAHHQRRIVFCSNSIHFHLETVTKKKYETHNKPENKAYFLEKWKARI